MKQDEQTMVSITINGEPHQVCGNFTVLQACEAAGVFVPTLCHHPRLPASGKCGACVVEVEGDPDPFKLACSTAVRPGMSIQTRSEGALLRSSTAARKILSPQPGRVPGRAPGRIPRTGKETALINNLMDLADEGLVDDSARALVSDQSQCIGCTRCVRACSQVQGMNILALNKDPSGPRVVTVQGVSLSQTDCIECGQCAVRCPTGAIRERDEVDRVLAALDNPDVVTVLQTAPSPRVALAESFGNKPGDIGLPKALIGAAKLAGFAYVFDTNFGADLTVVEEGNELLDRVLKGGPFPMFTSCCPAWVTLLEKKYPRLIPNLSSCRSPMMMLAAVVRTYFAQQAGIDPSRIFHVALMPCTAKKEEIVRPQLRRKDAPADVDAVLTTREFARLLQKRSIDLHTAPEAEFDNPLGEATGAGQIFGVTGGVMEAALRTAYELQTGKPLPQLEFFAVRGMSGVKEATVELGDVSLRVAAVHGAGAVRPFVERLIAEDGDRPRYHFVEIMCCTGGCVGGGGQPRSNDVHAVERRAAAVYALDQGASVRKSHENPGVRRIYEAFLGEPGSHLAHELLHTTYRQWQRPQLKVQRRDGVKAGEGQLLVLYGSQGGATAVLARELAAEAIKAGVQGVRCQPLDSVTPDALAKVPTVLVLTSTFTEGALPDNARKFGASLTAEQGAPLKKEGTKYAVCGFGSTSYDKFGTAAKLLDAEIARLGGQRITDLALVDELAPGKGVDTYETWWKQCLAALTAAARSALPPPKYTLALGLTPGRGRPPQPCPPGYTHVRLVGNRLLTADDYERPVRLFELDLVGSGLSYSVGDHVFILPRNDELAVAEFLEFLGLLPGTVVSVTPTVPGAAPDIFPQQLELGELFAQYLDVFSPVSRRFLEALTSFATNEDERAQLALLLGNDNKAGLVAFTTAHDHVQALAAFPSAVPPLENLVSLLPPLRARPYSAASAPGFSTTLQLSIVLNRYNVKSTGCVSEGRCTSYLYGLDPASAPLLAVRLRPGMLLPPADPSAPLVMIGLGTGIAPFRGFMQDRMRRRREDPRRPLGPALLYFGCRHRDKDFLFSDELEEFRQAGVLTELVTAFSHDQAHFVFVQDKLRASDEGRETLARALLSERGDAHLYYCGPALGIPQQVIAAMREALHQSGTPAHDKNDVDAALDRMQQSKRITIEAY
eukprot:TRINITY_DN11815_c0_g1_i1.p1 TRINITY_DN11815_c0_g1~~TRINITY_DN11815_c0_g1_i1.p1  ORF type:complete len:1178 (-),score=254.25 TRINITY_DN11815_c0_g1_i1:998-4531(-)